MGIFIAIAALIVGVANMSFNQAKANPDADNFFESKTHVTHQE